MKKNLFVTAIGGDIACAALRCIRRGYPCDQIVGCDILNYVQGLSYVDHFVLAPPYSDERQYLDFIEKICTDYDITHFLPMTEPEIMIARNNREIFKKHNVLLMTNPDSVIDIASSKYNTAKYLSEIGLKSPQTFHITDHNSQFTYPFIVKADCSCGSKNVFLVSNELDYKYAISKITNPIIQEYVGSIDKEYTMCIFSDGLKIKSITFSRVLGLGGLSTRVEYIEDDQLNRIAKTIAEKMHLIGSINVQMRKHNGEYCIFEINSRLSSTVGFRDLFGFKDLIWWLNILDGETPDLDVKISKNLIGVKTLNEMILDKDNANGQSVNSLNDGEILTPHEQQKHHKIYDLL